MLRKEVESQAQLVGDNKVNVGAHPVQVEASVQVMQLLMVVEHYTQVALRYWEEEHEQLVGLWREKVAWQRVQVLLEVQDMQLAMTEAQEVQVEGGVRN